MFLAEYPVLLVDDDPDVLAVSKLAMRNFTVFGSPVKLYTATSKAEAIEVITSQLSVPAQAGGRLMVAIIDVVMETDTAGLELCDYIRNDLDNKWCQLYVRTGQPGVAPERAVIDRYEINGYFSKVEASEDKLYTMVNTGARMKITYNLAQAGLLVGVLLALFAGLQLRVVPGQGHFRQVMEAFDRHGFHGPVMHRLRVGGDHVETSGPGLLPAGVLAFSRIHARVSDLPIIGVGGVRSAADVRQYLRAGASLVAMGTGVLADPRLPERIIRELERDGV